MLAEEVLACIHFLFPYVVFAGQICVPRQTRTPAFISYTGIESTEFQGKFLRGTFLAGPSDGPGGDGCEATSMDEVF